MKGAKRERDTFTQKEIAVALNNAVGMASRSTATLRQDEGRRRQIRAYIEELCKILWEEVAVEQALVAEELVQVLVMSALFIHAGKVMGTTNLPYFQDYAKRVLEDGLEEGEES